MEGTRKGTQGGGGMTSMVERQSEKWLEGLLLKVLFLHGKSQNNTSGRQVKEELGQGGRG